MVPKSRNISFEQVVHAPLADVYLAFTNSTFLRAWLCNAAQADPRLKGRIYLWWNSGYYMCGEYTQLSPNQTIAFTWHGRDDPGDTEVTVNLAEEDGSTLVRLKQTKVKSRGSWIRFRHEIHRGWVTGLENLASVLETGQDIRIVQRPMLGASLSDFGPELAAQLGVPVSEGIRLDDVTPGMGADLAGLQKDDVIVSASGKPTHDTAVLINILRGKQAGDKIEVVYYRGGKINIATMQLSTHLVPAVPEMMTGLVEVLRAGYDAVYNELTGCFEGVSEAEASRSPADGEWSAKEVLAHLIHGERDLHTWISDLVNNQERVSDGLGENVPARVTATVAAYPLVSDLLTEFKHHQIETLNVLANLPGEFQACRGNYWRMGVTVLQGAAHIRTHTSQLQAAIKTAQG